MCILSRFCAGANFTQECLHEVINVCAILKWILNAMIHQSRALSYHRMFMNSVFRTSFSCLTDYIASLRRSHIDACVVPGATLCCSDNERATPTGPECVTEHLVNNIIYFVEVYYLLWAGNVLCCSRCLMFDNVWTLHISNEHGYTFTILVRWFLYNGIVQTRG